MVTLVEFLGPLGGSKASRKDAVLGVMFYSHKFSGKSNLRTDEIRPLLVEGRVSQARKINIADVVAKAVPLVASQRDASGRLVWSLTGPGLEYCKGLLEPGALKKEIKHEAGSLEDLVKKMSDVDVRDYVEESIECLKVGALRACVVFLWSGAARTLQSSALGKGTGVLNAAIQKHAPKSRTVVKTIDDFVDVKDVTLLKVCRELGIINKGEMKVLDDARALRNNCGHPDKYSPGVKKVAAFIEDVTTIVFV